MADFFEVIEHTANTIPASLIVINKHKSSGSEDQLYLIYEVIQMIPRGRVATYGQIAKIAGLGRRARYVGYALRNTPENLSIPWYRVINAQGKIAIKGDSAKTQCELLRREKVICKNNKIDLKKFLWEF